MLARMLVAMTVCLAACAAVLAGEAGPIQEPLVLGEPDVATDALVAEPGSVVVEEGVPTEQAAPGPLVEELLAAGVGCATPAPITMCIDDDSAWCPYTVVDALFMQRYNDVGPLAVSSEFSDTRGMPVITAGDVRYPVAPGVRVFQAWRGPEAGGFEVGYLGVWGMHADALAVSPNGELAVPGSLGTSVQGSGFDTATAIEPVLHGTLNSVEVNVFATRVHDGCPRHDPLPWRRVGVVATADWILGVRWAGLDETATLGVTAATNAPPPDFNTTDYRVTTASHLVGPQIGHRRRLARGDWAIEGWAKAALAGSFLSQSQSAVVGPADLFPVRGPTSSTRMGVGLIGDLNATAIRRLGDHWGLRAGYTLLWFSGVAPAAAQWDFSNDRTSSGTRLVPGTVFLHGATLGLEANW